MEFIAKIQKLNRVAIPKNICEAMKLRKGTLIKVTIENLKKDLAK